MLSSTIRLQDFERIAGHCMFGSRDFGSKIKASPRNVLSGADCGRCRQIGVPWSAMRRFRQPRVENGVITTIRTPRRNVNPSIFESPVTFGFYP